MNRRVGLTIYLGVALNGTHGFLEAGSSGDVSGEPYAAGIKCGVLGIIFVLPYQPSESMGCNCD